MLQFMFLKIKGPTWNVPVAFDSHLWGPGEGVFVCGVRMPYMRMYRIEPHESGFLWVRLVHGSSTGISPISAVAFVHTVKGFVPRLQGLGLSARALEGVRLKV